MNDRVKCVYCCSVAHEIGDIVLICWKNRVSLCVNASDQSSSLLTENLTENISRYMQCKIYDEFIHVKCLSKENNR